jgi:hypothetical protein
MGVCLGGVHRRGRYRREVARASRWPQDHARGGCWRHQSCVDAPRRRRIARLINGQLQFALVEQLRRALVTTGVTGDDQSADNGQRPAGRRREHGDER